MCMNDELHGARLARVVALPHIQPRLPALDVDRLKDTGLGVRIGVDVGERRRALGKFDQPQAADGILVVIREQRPRVPGDFGIAVEKIAVCWQRRFAQGVGGGF